MEDLILVRIPEKFPHDTLASILPMCEEGMADHLEKWAIAELESYVQEYCLFRMPNTPKTWVCIRKPGIVSGSIPDNSDFGIPRTYKQFVSDKVDWGDYLSILESFFAAVGNVSAEPFVDRMTFGPNLGSLKKFAELVAQEAWEEFRNGKKPDWDAFDLAMADDKREFMHNEAEKRKEWERIYPERVPEEFVERLSEYWRGEDHPEPSGLDPNSWAI